uniref:Serpin n=1 Tax=Anatolica polita TaxID=442710 RepID=A0A2S1FWN8_9CUCU|nr:serpin [Anatolica polita]
MRRISVVLGAVLAILSSSTMAENKADLQVVQGNNHFSNDLYKVLSGNEGNVFFSPISVHAVLAMAYQGAQESTAEVFAACLKVPDAATAAEGYNAVMSKLNNVPNVTLLMANKVYLMAGFKLLEAFDTAISKKFLSEVELLDFAQNEASAKAINDWVKEKTREKIQDLIQAGDLNSDTRLVLVNAIYFKGDWLHKFDKELTKKEPFYLNNEDKVDVQMMHIKRKYYFSEREDLDAKILQLPYTNEDLSMVIILPNKRDGIKDLEKKLESFDLNNITEGLWNVEVNVALPRFKIETTIDLNDPLTKMGLGEIFDQSKANFRGMIGQDLYVSKVVQKAFIEVNEEGAEAAAATAIIIDSYMLVPSADFTANYPFVICLLSKKTVLFMGRIASF